MADQTTNMDALIEKIRPDIEKRLGEEFAKRVSEQYSWSIESNIREFTSAYIKENVLPEVEKMLVASKITIAASIVAAIEVSCKGLGDALAKNALERVSQNYNVAEIAKRLFG